MNTNFAMLNNSSKNWIHIRQRSTLHKDMDRYMVYSDKCIIPHLDAMSDMVRPYVNVSKFTRCKEVESITYKKGRYIWVNKQVVFNNYKFNFSTCSYTPFIREKDTIHAVKYKIKKQQNFTTSIKCRHNFVRIECFGKDNVLLQTNYYSRFHKNKTLHREQKSIYKKHGLKRNPMNVVMYVFESTSRLQFNRHMDRTRNFIINELGAVEMLGYNKIAENTFPNTVATLLGMPLEETNINPNKWMDNYSFIWNNFTEAGYTTYYIEDATRYNTFTLDKSGFFKQQFHHTMLPFMLAVESTLSDRYPDSDTCHHLNTFKILNEKSKEFITTYSKVPHFAFNFAVDLTHEDFNALSLEDVHVLQTLKELKDNGFLDNSILILMGDHGARFGDFRNTYQGHMEENMPALYISLPESFRHERPELYSNLNDNSHKLVNNFDIFATLVDIIDLGKGYSDPRQKTRYGISLLRPIPSRSCSEILIPPKYCACKLLRPVAFHESQLVNNITQWVVAKINKQLYHLRHTCATLKLSTLLDARISTYYKSVLLTMKVTPSNATFEANVGYYSSGTKPYFIIFGGISRTNKFGDQSKCIANTSDWVQLKHLCFCV